MSRVAIIDHGLGNLQAVEKALIKAGGGSTVFRCHTPDALRRADCVVLPGTGPLQACVDELRRLRIDDLLRDVVAEKSFLAINVGLHALGRQGLDLLPFDVVAMNEHDQADTRLPHLGWNRVHRESGDGLWTGIPQDAHFYFAHGNCIRAEPELVAGVTDYAGRFASVIVRDRFVGVQFQPEISFVNGLRFLANFINRQNLYAQEEP